MSVVTLGNASQYVRAFVCDLFRNDQIRGPLWKVYEEGTYDPESNSVKIPQFGPKLVKLDGELTFQVPAKPVE